MPQDANGLFLVGRLTKDAESRMIGENTVHDFRLAFTTREKRDGVWIDASNYIGVSYWGSPKMAEYLVKGKQVAVTGTLVYREWQSQDGSRRSVNEIRARDIQLLGGQQTTESKPVGSSGGDEDIPFAASVI